MIYFCVFWETAAVVTTFVIASSEIPKEIPGKLPGCSCCHAGARVMKERQIQIWLLTSFSCVDYLTIQLSDVYREANFKIFVLDCREITGICIVILFE